jgi:uncharacterized protein YjbJ (UPF0337 family)
VGAAALLLPDCCSLGRLLRPVGALAHPRKLACVYASAPTEQLAVANLGPESALGSCLLLSTFSQGNIMNKDQVKGQAKDIAGKVQEGAGKLVNSKEQQAKGAKLQVEGKLQKGYGDVKEVAKDARDSLKTSLKSHS